VRLWGGKKKVSTTTSTKVSSCNDEALATLTTDTSPRQTEEIVEVDEIKSIQNIEQYLSCINCTKKIMQGTCSNVLKCDTCGFLMRAAHCAPKISARVVIQADGDQLTIRLDQDILSKMFGVDVQAADSNTLAERLFSVQNFRLSYNNETFIATNVSM